MRFFIFPENEKRNEHRGERREGEAHTTMEIETCYFYTVYKNMLEFLHTYSHSVKKKGQKSANWERGTY